MSARVAKKRRITPTPGYGTISAGAMKSTYNKVVKLERQVRRMNSGNETKILDTALSFAVDATGEVPATGQLCLVPQGAADGERIGRKICVKSVQIRASVGFVPAAAATASSTGHFYLIQDRQCNGAAAPVLEVFSSTTLAVAMRDRVNDKRFRILGHWWHTFTPSAGVSGAYNNEQWAWQMYKRVNIPIEFQGATGAIGEIASNNIFLMCGSDGASDDLINVAGIARITFSDGGS